MNSFISSPPGEGSPLTVDALTSIMNEIWAMAPAPMPNKIIVCKSTYKTIRRWERERVMKYETGVPIGRKRFRFRGDRWKMINRTF